jgi:glycosyltransferase involved in cell wall biosynthesis
MTTIIIIPCYNEEARLQVAPFQPFLASHPAVNFLFVDDGSTDGTLNLLERLRSAAPKRMTVLSLEVNKGKAEAVRQGVHSCLSVSPAFIGFWDADLSTPLTAIPLFLEVYQSNPLVEVVLGSRLKSLGRLVERNPIRHYGGRFIATAISVITKLDVYDSQCGAKVFRNTDTLAKVFDSAFVSPWLFDVEILLRYIRMLNLTTKDEINRIFYELILPEWYHVSGSKLDFYDIINVPRELFRIWLAYREKP